MLLTARITRRAVVGAVAGTLMFVAPPSALADPPPNCTAGDLAQVAAGVSAGASVYFFTHPDVNAFFTGLAGQPRDQVRAEVKKYLDDHPQVQAEVSAIRQPLVDQRARCGVGDDATS